MKFGRRFKLPVMMLAVLLGVSVSLASATTPKEQASTSHKAQTSSHHSNSRHFKKSRKKRGQQAIDSGRARQIQEALVREHYLKAEPSGTWDAATQAAMRRYQSDQGWQTKVVPDSRALIRLGLGPSHDHLLNPESAMVSGPRLHANAGAPAPGANSALPGQSATPVSTGSDLSAAQ